ncbi:MAG: dTDP-4-dehydrorhamnose 3,5-epimerase [Lachnospiraceae bacterium]|nr:dTDP-4-dehydrorhamnose 3,5-epimerase [Lachnospiraceae bacterium]
MGRFNLTETGIKDLKIIKYEPFLDERGYFFEAYNKNDFIKMGIEDEFVQDNESMSSYGVLRGLHFQINYPQAKLVRCLKGKVYDVAVDLRPNSPTYGKYHGVILTEDNKTMFYIPKNFAHGFLVLSDVAIFTYKVTDFYHPNDEGGIMYNDHDLNIDWPIPNDKNFKLILSEKDKCHPNFKDLKITHK